MPNPFCHIELNTTNLPAAKTFYSKLFDWQLEEVPGAPSAWLAYVMVDDVRASTAKAKSLGATVMKDVTDVMGHGQMSVLIDPTGAAIALWQPAQKTA